MKKMFVLSCIAAAFLLSGCISLGKHSHHNRSYYEGAQYGQSQYDRDSVYRYERGDYRRN
jgi:uncharacterized protein YceK